MVKSLLNHHLGRLGGGFVKDVLLKCSPQFYRVVKGGVPRGGGSLMFPKVPQSSLGILRVPQLPPPLNTPPLGTLQQLVGR